MVLRLNWKFVSRGNFQGTVITYNITYVMKYNFKI